MGVASFGIQGRDQRHEAFFSGLGIGSPEKTSLFPSRGSEMGGKKAVQPCFDGRLSGR